MKALRLTLLFVISVVCGILISIISELLGANAWLSGNLATITSAMVMVILSSTESQSNQRSN